MKKITLIIISILLAIFLTYCSDSTKSSNPSESLKYKGNWSTDAGLSDSVFFSIIQVGDSAKIDQYNIKVTNIYGIYQAMEYQSDGICYVSNDQFVLQDSSAKITGQAISDTTFQGNFTIYNTEIDSITGNYTAHKQQL